MQRKELRRFNKDGGVEFRGGVEFGGHPTRAIYSPCVAACGSVAGQFDPNIRREQRQRQQAVLQAQIQYNPLIFGWRC
jgi:hypothetical protein